MPDSVFNSGGDKGKLSFIENESRQLFRFRFYHGGCFKEILAFFLVALYLALLLGLCCVILVLLCSYRRAERKRDARLAELDQEIAARLTRLQQIRLREAALSAHRQHDHLQWASLPAQPGGTPGTPPRPAFTATHQRI